MWLTEHASQRLQQRAIPEAALELLRRYACIEYSNGSRIRYFDRRSWRQLMQAVGTSLKEPERLSGLYAIETETGVIVTAGHRYRRIKRDYQPGRRQARRRSHRSHSLQSKR
ncbi:MAG: hypothetical protein GVY22_09810 [Gammaproteobacteria bacterium]|jgi:hypothetical protein|nr:hypothetical protein [Gammaproteobacteria bacterium]